MLRPIKFLSISLLVLLAIACKQKGEDAKGSDAGNINTEISENATKRASKKELTPEDIAMLKSVMSKVMSDVELKKFTSYTITAELVDNLANQDGPFTVFAPSNKAFELLSPEQIKFYASPENKSGLAEMLKSHIVLGKLDSETIFQNIQKNGTAKFKTMDGNTLTASKSGDAILLSDSKGNKARVLDDGTEASNGIVYTIDGVLYQN